MEDLGNASPDTLSDVQKKFKWSTSLLRDLDEAVILFKTAARAGRPLTPEEESKFKQLGFDGLRCTTFVRSSCSISH